MELSGFVYNSNNKLISYNDNNDNTSITYDISGRISTIMHGSQGTGNVDVIEYDDANQVKSLINVPYGYGIIPAGSSAILNGKKYLGVGLNFYDIVQHSNDDLILRFQDLQNNNIPFIRVNMGEFAAGTLASPQWYKYVIDKSLWYSKFDFIVALAEEYNIGLIVSMFWRYKTIPDMMKLVYGKRDAISAWGDYNSNTRKFMRDYTTEFVTRYKNSKFIYGWEFCNEPNTPLNLTYPLTGEISGYDISSGSPSVYTVEASDSSGGTDIITIEQMYSAFEEWCSIVNNLDQYKRMTSSGCAIGSMRDYSISNNTGIWSDTLAQWTTGFNGKSSLERANSNFFNTYSTHIYNDANVAGWYFIDKDYNPSDLIKLSNTISQKNNKMLFLGEWGSLKNTNGNGTTDLDEVTYFQNMVLSIKQSKIPVSCIWNYGYLLSSVTSVFNWNVDNSTFTSTTNNRYYQMQEINKINQYFSSIL